MSNRLTDYTDPSTEPWWVDVLIVVFGIVVLIGATSV